MAKPHSTRRAWSRMPCDQERYAEYIERQREASTGRRHSDESIQKMREIWMEKGHRFTEADHVKARNVNAGRRLSLEHKDKIRAAMKGLTRSAEHQQKLNDSLRGKPKPEAVRAKISDALTGREGRPHRQPARASISAIQKARWADVRSPDSRCSTEYKSWRAAVLSRDKYICRECGTQNAIMHAHHIKPFRDHPELRFAVDNGLTLCASCHARIEGPLVKLESQVKRAKTILDKLRKQGVDVSTM